MPKPIQSVLCESRCGKLIASVTGRRLTTRFEKWPKSLTSSQVEEFGERHGISRDEVNDAMVSGGTQPREHPVVDERVRRASQVEASS